jgi:signal transduction histidine kinase
VRLLDDERANQLDLERLANEQAALRRVATLVARGVPAEEVFSAVAEEAGRLVSIDSTLMLRYEADGTATVVAGWTETEIGIPVGARWTLEGDSVSALVLRTGRPARIDNYANATGSLAARLREVGARSAAGAPIVVDGRLWGVMVTGSTQPEPLPVGLESRLAEFTELVATAISNAQSRTDLAASRARVVAAADETRRRIERDLHDGTQQRLVSIGLGLRTAEAMVPSELGELKAQLSRTAKDLAGAVEDLLEVTRRIHPPVLSVGGLGPALRTLARRSAVPVELDVSADRLPEHVEAAAYYVVSEAITNAVKHAKASVVHVGVEPMDGLVRLSIRDDGVGGADPRQGAGLIGLGDRVDALGGRIQIKSPPGGGTSVLVTLPIEGR